MTASRTRGGGAFAPGGPGSGAPSLIHGGNWGQTSGTAHAEAAIYAALRDSGVGCRPDEFFLRLRADDGDARAAGDLADAIAQREAQQVLARRLAVVVDGDQEPYPARWAGTVAWCHPSHVDDAGHCDVCKGPAELVDPDVALERGAADAVRRGRDLALRGFKRRRSRYSIEGRGLTIEGAREVMAEWPQSPARLAERLRTCGKAWAIGVGREGPIAAPMGCDCGLCPPCLGRHGGARISDWLPVIEACVEIAGAFVVHMTSTRPADEGGERPVVLTRRELERGNYAVRAAKHQGRAVPGESLARGIGSVYGAWRHVTHDQGNGRGEGSRQWWQEHVIGALVGREWTGRRCVGGAACGRCRGHRDVPHVGPWRLRWHVHQHALIVLRDTPETGAIPWYTDRSGRTVACGGACQREEPCPWCRGGRPYPGSWWARWLSEWLHRMPGADVRGQHLRRVDDTGAALREVLKYPFKPAELTSAQSAEVVAAAGGLHHHQPSGLWHGRSNLARAARGEPIEIAPADLQLVDALAEGYRRREELAEERACTMLYRKVRPTEPPRPRRQTLPLEGDPWEASPHEKRPELAPVTVRYLADRVLAGEATEALWTYDPRDGSWTGPEVTPLAPLLRSVTRPRADRSVTGV